MSVMVLFLEREITAERGDKEKKLLVFIITIQPDFLRVSVVSTIVVVYYY